MTLLALRDVCAFYGPSQALFGVGFDVASGEVVALMGRNGMGKSTTVKAICRMVTTRGAITFDGEDVSGLASHEAARLGIGLVPEGRRCFSGLTVHENLIAAARAGDWTSDRVFEFFKGLKGRKNQLAGSLSGGEQQMLAIGRALMTNPRLLILDEATEGLAPLVRKEIWDAIAELKSQSGLAILVIDKTLTDLKRVCDRAVILERGETVWNGAISALTVDISERYIGV